MWLLAISVWGAPRQATASEAYQQRRERISVSFRNASLAEVLQRIKQQTGYYILYNSDAVRGIGGISFSKADAPVREVLDEALRGTRLEYSIDDDTIVIRGRSGGGNASAPQKAPDKVVSGRVTDTAGAPLVGVNILIQGTATGVVSGSDGGFSIRMPEGRDNLIFSYIGYVSQTLPSAQTRLVRLVQDEQEIENVVVTGIFTRKKESYTGSATTITSGQLARVSNRNVFESLKNIEPSLYIMDNTLMGSDPNTLPDMQLRGITTFPSESTGVNIKGNYQNRPNQPLFILDGFETTAEKVMDMDMTRIESITILKDAAAKALYGSKAANGVIVIETKRLAGNQELVTYTGSIEVSMPDLTSYNLCNAWEKLEAERIEGVYTSANPQTQVDLTKRYNALKAQVLGGLDTYWLAKPLRTGVGHKHTLSVELGDSRKLRAMIDFSYNNVAGVMKGSERTVLSGDVNVSYRKKSFLFRNILSVSNTRSDNSPWGDFGDYARMNPYWSAVDPQTGQIARWAYDEVANPMYDATLGTLDRETYTSVTNNFYAEWQATEALKLTARLGIAVKRSDADEFYPAKHSKFATSAYESTSMQLRKGSYQLDNGKSSDISGEIYANYAKNWGRLTVLFQVSGQIASYTEMRSGIHTVRRDIDFQHIIALHIIIFFGRSTDYRIGRQYDYTCMICSNTDFIFSTNHTVRFNATDFRALDRKALITIIQFSTVYSNNHFLSGSYIRRTTNNLQGFRAANIHGCNVQVIGIRMFFASKNFTDDKSFQSTFDGLNFFYPSGFQTNRGKCCCYFIRL